MTFISAGPLRGDLYGYVVLIISYQCPPSALPCGFEALLASSKSAFGYELVKSLHVIFKQEVSDIPCRHNPLYLTVKLDKVNSKSQGLVRSKLGLL